MIDNLTYPISLESAMGDSHQIRQVFSHFPSGIAVLGVETEGQRHCLVASSFMVGVSLDPVLVAVAIQQTSESWPTVRAAERIGVSIFSEDQVDLIRQMSGKDRAQRFDGVETQKSDHGAVFLVGAAVWFETSVFELSAAGDHVMALLEVSRLGAGERDPIIWHKAGFSRLEK